MDANILALYVFGTIVFTLLGVSLPLFVAFFWQFKLKNKARHEQALLNQRLEVQAQAMDIIAQELHDNLGQLLGLTRRGLTRAQAHYGNDQGRDVLEKSIQNLTRAIHDVRQFSHSLNSSGFREQGLLTTLARDLEAFQDASGILTEWTVAGTPVSLTPERELVLYRMIQEALQNILKHAHATRVTVSCSFNERSLTTIITDNGCGFTTDSNQPEGIGLKNMASRAAILKATCSIQSAPAKGTTITIHIPLHDEPDTRSRHRRSSR